MKNIFKKTIISGLTLATLFTFTACGKKEEVLKDENVDPDYLVDDTQIANPWTEYEGLDEALNKLEFDNTSLPEEIDGKQISDVSVMSGENPILQVVYKDIIVRKAKGTDDISGDYSEYNNVIALETNDYSYTTKGNDDVINTLIWTDGEYTYSVSSVDGLTDIVSLMQNIK